MCSSMAQCATKDVLKQAVWKGDVNKVKELLANNANVEEVDAFGRRPFHHAATSGWWEVTETLLDYNAENVSRGPLGSTPLHYAAQYGRKYVVELWLARAADIEARDMHGNIPMIVARGQNRREIVDLLVCRMADMRPPPEPPSADEWLCTDTLVDNNIIPRKKITEQTQAHRSAQHNTTAHKNMDTLTHCYRNTQTRVNRNSISESEA